MRAKIGFIAMLIGGAGLDGTESILSYLIMIIGLLICWKESKKIDASPTK